MPETVVWKGGDVAGENVHFEPYFGSDSVMYRTAFEV